MHIGYDELRIDLYTGLGTLGLSQMKELHKRIETVANLSIILVAIVICLVLAKRFFAGSSENANLPEQISAGSKMDLPEVRWSDSRQTLLLVLSQGCHFCSESAEFYKQLVQKAEGTNDTKLIALIPQAVSEGHKYLNELSISIADVRQVPVRSIHVRGTPSLILVDSQGIVKAAWLGKVSPESEAEVLKNLQCSECGSLEQRKLVGTWSQNLQVRAVLGRRSSH